LAEIDDWGSTLRASSSRCSRPRSGLGGGSRHALEDEATLSLPRRRAAGRNWRGLDGDRGWYQQNRYTSRLEAAAEIARQGQTGLVPTQGDRRTSATTASPASRVVHSGGPQRAETLGCEPGMSTQYSRSTAGCVEAWRDGTSAPRPAFSARSGSGRCSSTWSARRGNRLAQQPSVTSAGSHSSGPSQWRRRERMEDTATSGGHQRWTGAAAARDRVARLAAGSAASERLGAAERTQCVDEPGLSPSAGLSLSAPAAHGPGPAWLRGASRTS